MTTKTATRQPAGIPVGGQFAPTTHAEPTSIALTGPQGRLDEAAVGLVADAVRTQAANEVGRWQRQLGRPYPSDSPVPLSAELVEMERQANGFESLPRAEQDKVLDKLKLSHTKHLLEPGQRLGNDSVQVADDLDPSTGNVGLALAAQKVISDAELPGTITLTELSEDTAKFAVLEGLLTHSVDVSPRILSFSAESTNEEDEDYYTRSEWLDRSYVAHCGGSVLDPGRHKDVRSTYEQHKGYAVMMDVVASSSFREAEDHLGELDRGGRTAVLKTDGTEYTLDVSGDEPALLVENGQALHPSMVRGFLDHMAKETGHADGAAFAAELREVFQESDRRLVP